MSFSRPTHHHVPYGLLRMHRNLPHSIEIWHGLYMIFNVRIWSFCIRIHTGPRPIASSDWLSWGKETAQTFDSGQTRPQSAHKALRKTVTHPCGGHTWSCLTATFGSEVYRCVPPTLLWNWRENKCALPLFLTNPSSFPSSPPLPRPSPSYHRRLHRRSSSPFTCIFSKTSPNFFLRWLWLTLVPV